jgi:hypothetical protein
MDRDTDSKKFEKEGLLRPIKESLLKKLRMEAKTFQTLKISTKDKHFPVKIQLFPRNNNPAQYYPDDVQIALSFTHKSPSQENNDYLTTEPTLIIPQPPNQPQPMMYISILTNKKWNGYIGCAFNSKPKKNMDKFTLKPENDSKKMTKIYDEATQSMQRVAWEAKFWKFMKGRKDFGIIDPMEYIGNLDKMEEFIGMLGMRGKGKGGEGGGEGGVEAGGGFDGKAGGRLSMQDSVGQGRAGLDPRPAGAELKTLAMNELKKSGCRDLSSEC